MEVNKNSIKLVMGSFLVMTSISMGLITFEQWFSKACFLYGVHNFLKHIFSFCDPKHELNWTNIKVDLAWKGAGVLILAWSVKISLGLPQNTALRDILMELCPILFALGMMRYFKLHRNQSQDLRLMGRCSLAPDSARTTFSFLENVIKGKKATMKKPSTKNFEKILEEHFEKEKIKAQYHPQLVILFPEGRDGQGNKHALGSVEDILYKEKEEGSEHTLTKESISYEYFASSGRHRRAQLEVLKFRNKGDVIYVAISENRLLKTFYQMLFEPCIDFRWENFQMQFNIYRRELARLLDEDESCREKWEMVHYTEEQGAFTQAVMELLQRATPLNYP